MRMRIIPFTLGLTSALLLATPTEAQKGRGDRSKLTIVDIQEAGAGIVTARDAVRLLRPQWLSPRMGRVASSDMLGSGGGRQEVVVYIDDIRQPDLESLTTVLAAKIFELKYLDQNRAVQARGTGPEAGVIEVTTVDKRK